MGGTDPVDVKLLAGYPGNSALYLNGAGAFTTVPVPTLPANIAYTNVNNVFTGNIQTIAGSTVINELDLQTGSLLYRLLNYDNKCGVYHNPLGGWAFYTDVNGNFSATAAITGKNLNSTEAGAAGHLQVSGPVYPGHSSASWVKQGSWYWGGHSSYGLYTNTGIYAESNVWCAAVVARGNIHTSGSFYEADRGTPLGHWIDVSAAGHVHGQLEGVGGSMSYCLIGKTMLLNIAVYGSLVAGGASAVYITIPGGWLGRGPGHAVVSLNHSARAWYAGFAATGAGQYYLIIYNEATNPFPDGFLYIYGNILIPLQ